MTMKVEIAWKPATSEWLMHTCGVKQPEAVWTLILEKIQGPPQGKLPVLMRQLEEERINRQKMHQAPPQSRNPQRHSRRRRQEEEAGRLGVLRHPEAKSVAVKVMMRSDMRSFVLRTIRWQMPEARSAPAQEGIARSLSKYIPQNHHAKQLT